MFIRIIKSLSQKSYAFVQAIYLTNAQSVFKSAFQPLSVKYHSKSGRIFSNYHLSVIAIAAVFFASCQKDQLSDTATLNSTTTSAMSAADARVRRPGLTGEYGSLIDAPRSKNSTDFELNVADQLGISCLRERVVVPARSLNHNLVPELNTDYKVLLNFTIAKRTKGAPSPFVSDLQKYKSDLNDILNTFTVMPEVAVIENEEGNRFYYNGKASEYIDELNTAINVMHARGIKVTNGGLGGGLEYLVYLDLVKQGKDDEAAQFKQITHVTPTSSTVQERGDFADELLTNYAKMDLDYVNFHWKCSAPGDAQALTDVIDYLKKRTGKTIISNELGQLDTNPNTVPAMLQACTDENLPYMVWYSPDEHAGKRDTPLQHSNGSLTPSGIAYQNFLAN